MAVAGRDYCDRAMAPRAIAGILQAAVHCAPIAVLIADYVWAFDDTAGGISAPLEISDIVLGGLLIVVVPGLVALGASFSRPPVADHGWAVFGFACTMAVIQVVAALLADSPLLRGWYLLFVIAWWGFWIVHAGIGAYKALRGELHRYPIALFRRAPDPLR